jgi:hypothetical protein
MLSNPNVSLQAEATLSRIGYPIRTSITVFDSAENGK